MCSIDDVDETWDVAGKSVSVDYWEPFQKWYRLYMWTGSQMYYTLYLLSGFFFLGTSLKLEVSILIPRGFRGTNCPLVPLSEAESDTGETVGVTSYIPVLSLKAVFFIEHFMVWRFVCVFVSSVICCNASYKVAFPLATEPGLEVFLLVKQCQEGYPLAGNSSFQLTHKRALFPKITCKLIIWNVEHIFP